MVCCCCALEAICFWRVAGLKRTKVEDKSVHEHVGSCRHSGDVREAVQQVKSLCGINLHGGKRELVKARLSKRLRTLRLTSFEEYLDYVRDDPSGDETTFMLNVLSTNLTSFFREASHFDYLAEGILAPMAAASGERRLRIWSAGCSSGEEPYCLAIILRETIRDLDRWDARILATDLSTGMLRKAIDGIY